MEVPSSVAGKIASILVKQGDRVSQGITFVTIEPEGRSAAASSSAAAASPPLPHRRRSQTPAPKAAPAGAPGPAIADFSGVHASPGVRRLARELDIDLTKLTGTGEKGRVTKDDLKASLSGPGKGAGGSTVPGAWAFPKFRPSTSRNSGRSRSRQWCEIKHISGPFLHRAWLNIPDVTHNDEADITEIEKYRKELDDAARGDKKTPYRVSLLPFLMKASVNALKGVSRNSTRHSRRRRTH